MRLQVFWRVAVVQLLTVGAVSVLLAAFLSHGFFADWGWLAGPGAWMLCACLTARVVGLPVPSTLLGAFLAGFLSAVTVVLGLHWLGLLVAVGLLAAWCARLPREGAAWT